MHARLTISKDFTRRLLTANGPGFGYVMTSDGKTLFHADHKAPTSLTALSCALTLKKATGTPVNQECPYG